MATINHIFDSGQGKLGNLVLYKVNGQGRVRTRAEHFNDRRSPAQLAQRQRMQAVNSFLKPFRDLIRITYAAEAGGSSAVHAARAYHMRHALTGEYPDISVDKGRALLSRGPLPVSLNAKVSVQEEGLLIEWENCPEDEREHAHDTLVVVALFTEKGRAGYHFTDTRRTCGSYVLKPARMQGNADVWISFRKRDQTLMSNSMYLGNLDLH